MKKLSFIMPSRNGLKYLRWAYNSLRKNCNPDHEICMYDDFSDDGTWDWMKETEQQDPNLQIFRNDGPTRLGCTMLYDELIDESQNDIIVIFHNDMYAAPDFDKKILDETEPGKVVSSTRIEPPLHPPGNEKIIADFGTEPENFNEKGFLDFVKSISEKNKGKKTKGMFAPWAIYKKDFTKIGGHDPLFAPQSREDSLHEDRILLVIENNEIKFLRLNELFNKYQNLAEPKDDEDYIIDFQKHNIKIATATANSNQSVGRNYINKIIKKKNKKEMVKVRTSWGETICTTDHSLLDKNLNPTKPNNLEIHNMWKPLKINDWTRRTIQKSIDFNKINLNIRDLKEKRKSNAINYNLPKITDIDEYGNNQQLIDICEFLGFFVAEGSTFIDYNKNSYAFSFDSNNLEMLNYFKEKSLSLFPNLDYGKYKVSKKENYKDVYKYSKSSKILAHFLRSLVGNDSRSKKVPEFIFNIPKAYQEAFLYGYLCGDGYLGSRINRQKADECFSVDKKLLFNENLFPLLTWKSTSKSDMLTAGIIYLLRKNYPKIKIRINFPTKEKNVYNVTTLQEYRENKLEIKNLGILDCDVYDLEVERTHTFIDAMGLFGVHNSDIFNRFILAGYTPVQLFDNYVYHMTCRGSRFNPKITRVGTMSEEWKRQNKRSERNFIRKWGHMVKTDNELKPVVPHKYDISFIVHNCRYDLLELLEPWGDRIYIDLDESEIKKYIENEQPNTNFDLSKRIIGQNHDNIQGGIILEFNGNNFNQESFNFIMNLSDIITDTNQTGIFEYGIFRIQINDLTTYEKQLIRN